VIAMPVYNEEANLAETLDSLLAQSESDLRVVIVDNRSMDGTAAIAKAYARTDPRVTYEGAETYVGMVENWKRAFFRARELHPSAPYFAWASGHDILEPRWLEALAAELDAYPSVIGAFPSGLGVRAAGGPPSHLEPAGDTFGIRRARDRIKVPLRGMAIQGLFRPNPIQRAGVARRVLAPDRLLMAELAAHGQIRHVPERLWERRMNPKMTKSQTRAHQRAAIFSSRARLLGHVHWLAVHAGALVWSLVVRGTARPEVSRAEGVAVVTAYVRTELPRHLRAVRARHRVRLTRLRKTRRRIVRKRVRRLRSRIRKDYRRARRELRRVPKRARRVLAVAVALKRRAFPRRRVP
jgi:glycosyltransferase involved in cell wall biosynthesis